jgi:hypothetical protein
MCMSSSLVDVVVGVLRRHVLLIPGRPHAHERLDRAALVHGGVGVGELENYENSYRFCYVRGPAGIIVELAEKID